MKTVLYFSCSDRHACGVRMDGINRVAFREGWHVQIVDNAFTVEAARAAIEFWQPIGLIVGSGKGTEGVTKELIGKIPVVFFDVEMGTRGEGVYVSLDSAAVGRMAARELLRCELRHFAFVGFAEPYYWSNERGAAYADTVRAANGTFVGDFPCVMDEDSMARCQRLGAWLTALPRPCGIFAANDIVAEEVLVAAERQGLVVPDDLSVIGVDDNQEICLSARPRLTSIAADFKSAAEFVAETLAYRIAHPRRKVKSPLRTYSAIEVVRRESTLQPCPVDCRVTKALNFIAESERKNLSVAEVVAAMGCSRRLAEMHFRTTTGKTILEAINDAIFDRACELLGDPRLSVTDVQKRLGGVTHDTLRRIFLVRVGKPPRAWRMDL